MSIKLISKAWDLDLPTSEKFVLVALADNASDEGICWPSVRRVARKVAMHPRAVIRIIDRLEAQGLVVTEEKGGGRKANRYGLHLEAGKALPAFVPSHLGGDHDHPSQVQPGKDQVPAAVTVDDQCSGVTPDMNGSQSSDHQGSHEPSNNHQKKRQTEPGTAQGVITEVKKTPTKSGINRVLFKIGDLNGKAFGPAAEKLLKWNGEYAELTGKYETSHYGTEFIAEHGFIPANNPSPRAPTPRVTGTLVSPSIDRTVASDKVTFDDLERLYMSRFTTAQI